MFPLLLPYIYNYIYIIYLPVSLHLHYDTPFQKGKGVGKIALKTAFVHIGRFSSVSLRAFRCAQNQQESPFLGTKLAIKTALEGNQWGGAASYLQCSLKCNSDRIGPL